MLLLILNASLNYVAVHCNRGQNTELIASLRCDIDIMDFISILPLAYTSILPVLVWGGFGRVFFIMGLNGEIPPSRLHGPNISLFSVFFHKYI